MKTTLRKVRHLSIAAVLAIGITAGGIASAESASAGGVSYVWSTTGASSVPMYYAANTRYSAVMDWMPNGTKFQMSCWFDNAGNRWFFGQAYNTGQWGYVTAGPVRNQIAVPHC